MSEWDIERQPIPTAKNNTQDEVLELREKMIANLQAELEQAGKVCTGLNSENGRLREELDQVHAEKNKLITNQYHLDYQVCNQQKRIEDIGKTLETLTLENRHLKGLVKLWME